MDKALLVYVVIETVVFFIPIMRLFIAVGEYKSQIEDIKKRVDQFQTIDNRLTKIETKLDLLLSGKLKHEES